MDENIELLALIKILQDHLKDDRIGLSALLELLKIINKLKGLDR